MSEAPEKTSEAPKGRVVLEVTDPVLLDFAREVGSEGPVAVEGRRTRWDLGGSLDEGVRLVNAPAGIVDYRPEEMTVQVRAGTLVSELDAVLAAAGQRAALTSRGGTVGGVVAVGRDHRDVLGRGTLRDSVLQVRYVSAEGRMVTGGGPVVKNVSGFNLPKLMVGSLGTLGCLAELVLRTNPMPAVSRWLRADGVSPFDVYDRLFDPSSVLWNGSSVWVHLEGHEADVESEERRLQAIAAFVAVGHGPDLPSERWTMAPSDLRNLDSEATGSFVASVGVGRVWAKNPQPFPVTDPVTTMLADRLKANFDPTGRLNPGRRP